MHLASVYIGPDSLSDSVVRLGQSHIKYAISSVSSHSNWREGFYSCSDSDRYLGLPSERARWQRDETLYLTKHWPCSRPIWTFTQHKPGTTWPTSTSPNFKPRCPDFFQRPDNEACSFPPAVTPRFNHHMMQTRNNNTAPVFIWCKQGTTEQHQS